jgi:hypothetical protein
VSNNQVKPAIEDNPENIPPPPKYQEVVEMNKVTEKAGNSVAMNGYSATNYDKSVDELPAKAANGGKEDKKDGDSDSKADEKKEEETPMVGLFEVVRTFFPLYFLFVYHTNRF